MLLFAGADVADVVAFIAVDAVVAVLVTVLVAVVIAVGDYWGCCSLFWVTATTAATTLDVSILFQCSCS